MKRNSLTTAILAGLTGVAGMAGVANAVNINPDGLGQVLLYPYYTAREGNDTMISVVNTTDQVKAVKVRFMEALNSREVLDFNLYLSPYDVWTAGVTDLGGGVPGMRTFDSSCTVPYFYGISGGEQPFLNYQYGVAPNRDGGPTGIERAASGYIELIEMGTVVHPALAPAAIHGPTFNCGALSNAWGAAGGTWNVDPTAGIDAATGGLFGGGAIISVDEGFMISYNADAIDGFWPVGDFNHTDPGDLFPSLGSGDENSWVFDNGVLDAQTWQFGIQAVDAVLSYDRLFNEYSVNDDVNARSEWVLTFPTKRFHTDAAPGGPGIAVQAPFTEFWEVHLGGEPACEEIEFRVWDREENEPQHFEIGVSPRPPGLPGFLLCREANVVRFAHGGQPDNTEILKEVNRPGNLGYVNFDLPAAYKEGWVRFDLGGVGANARLSDPAASGDIYRGLPVVGFWANTVTNGALASGVLSNYGGAYHHRGSRMVNP